MKKLLSLVALIAASIGFSSSAFAADKLIAYSDRGGTDLKGCVWDHVQIALTSAGTVWLDTLNCSGVKVAKAQYTGNGFAVAPVVGIGEYYSVRKSGDGQPIGSNFAVYKPVQTANVNCSSGAYNTYVYTDLTSASTARGMTMYYQPNACGGTQCPLNIKSVSGGYQLWCGL